MTGQGGGLMKAIMKGPSHKSEPATAADLLPAGYAGSQSIVPPVFVTTYIPFFLAANYVPDMEPKKRKRFLIGLIPLGFI